MNRTASLVALLLSVPVAAGRAQVPAPAPDAKAQAARIDELVAAIRAAESKLRTVVVTMRAESSFVGGFTAKTAGTLHVVRGEQGKIHTRFEFDTGDGMTGRSEMSQTKGGILWFNDNPLAGDSFVQIDAKDVADVEWAGEVLGRDDMPGMAPRGGSGAHAASPLGSAIVEAVKRQFDLAIDSRPERAGRNGDAGTWLVGPRKKGLDVQDPGVPVADRVELFVRQRDHALLEMRQLQGDVVLQLLLVDSLVLDGEIADQVFQFDVGGQRPEPVRDTPLWAQIDEILREAARKCEAIAAAKNKDVPVEKQVAPDVRPSRRPNKR